MMEEEVARPTATPIEGARTHNALAPGRNAGFSALWEEFLIAQSKFDDDLCDVIGGDFDGLDHDPYDGSLEIREVGNDVRLSEACQRLIFEAGFAKVYVNHKDGAETIYTWKHDGFEAQRGWRRRYVKDATASTSNVLVGEREPGYYEISFWPDSWNTEACLKWRESGYMRVVPDPLDPVRSAATITSPDAVPQSEAARRDQDDPSPNTGRPE